MTIQRNQHKHGSISIELTACPVDGCDREFETPAGASRRVHLLSEHDASDFNL